MSVLTDSSPPGIELTPEQLEAVQSKHVNVLVTAGAGTGKTRTLVARYISHLSDGYSPRQVVAITFTERAAREMRNRIREAVRRVAMESTSAEGIARWRALEGQMDAARIGTIHSLCSEILRAHAAEAGVDPQFEVADEGLSLSLKSQTIEDTLFWASGDEGTAPLFQVFSPDRLRALARHLLNRRLELKALLAADAEADVRHALGDALQGIINAEPVRNGIAELRAMRGAGDLNDDAGERLGGQVDDLLDHWLELEEQIRSDQHVEAAAQLFAIRRQDLDLRAGKKDSRAKAIIGTIRNEYELKAAPWLGGESNQDLPPDPDQEQVFVEVASRLKLFLERALERYEQHLDQQHMLDFDHLEQGALELLSNPTIRARWQARFSHVLVDEFQDTNARQRAIVEALAGDTPGRFFAVGDARQSIYRFRGADVTVFRETERDLLAGTGARLELDLSFRAHRELLATMDAVLARLIGTEDVPERLYQVPYSLLRAKREAARPGIQAPHVEVVMGFGERSANARPNSARALAYRLAELRERGEVRAWDDVALLFRASTAFGDYEDALDEARIPFLTVAGRGFYSRPEIRDLLNILSSLVDPLDEAALAGLLRSPAIGLSDVGLYQLRWSGADRRRLQQAMQDNLGELNARDLASVDRARQFLAEHQTLVDRVSVAELLKRVLDWLDYRALLASDRPRYWRNVDKLVSDAHRSGLVQVRAFLEYLQTLRDVGAREGEAPAEAVGAVRLMTIHKAKGLEFDVVILADASRQAMTRPEVAYLLPEIGLAFSMDRTEINPLAYRISKWHDAMRSAAEENRLLYVAATRAREKLIVSGHISRRHGRVRAAGWLGRILEVLDFSLVDHQEEWSFIPLADGGEVAVWSAPELELPQVPRLAFGWPKSELQPIFDSPPITRTGVLDEDLAIRPARKWRATGGRVSAAVVGRMVHEVIRVWQFPGDPELDSLLVTLAINEKLVDPSQREQAIERTLGLLGRLRDHSVRGEIESAIRRFHESPYTRPHPEWGSDSGRIDLLYVTNDGWKLIDFKVDELTTASELEKAAQNHASQLHRYADAIEALLGQRPEAALCFLDAMGELKLEPVR